MASHELLMERCKVINVLRTTILIIFLQNINFVDSRIHDKPSNALHFPFVGKEKQWGDDFRVVQVDEKRLHYEESDFLYSSTLQRNKRSAGSEDSDSVDPKNLIHEFDLTDSHSTLIMHWAGEGSDIIIALAKRIIEDNSDVFISEDYGMTFSSKKDLLKVNSSTDAVIHKYYNTKLFIRNYVFTDVKHDCVFTTRDVKTFETICHLPFKPNVLSMNPEDYNMILGMDNKETNDLYLSTDFGRTWRLFYTNVKAFFWGIPPHDDARRTIYIYERLGTMGQALKITLLQNMEKHVVSLATDVTAFHVQESYIYLTKSVSSSHNPNLQFWVSHDRGRLRKADFPFANNTIPLDYYVADASEGQLMVCVAFANSTNLYISEVKGSRFTLSLEQVVYFNPKITHNSAWMRFYTDETFADVTKVGGLKGVYIASQQINHSLSLETQRTLISFDKGGEWRPIPRPTNNDVQLLNGCDENDLTNCSLHLTQEFHHLYPQSQATPILSEDSAPGLILASGMVGKTLKTTPDVFVSSNAGLSWKAVLSGQYIYSMADHGGVLVAVQQFVPVNEFLYSIDEGETWLAYRFRGDKIHVYGLLTEPGEKTTIISIFGSRLGHHSWIIIRVNFLNAFPEKQCSEDDYKWWSMDKDVHDRNLCVLGHVTEYQRRRAHASCYNGKEFVREVQTKNCSCTRLDYECDLGFKKMQYSDTCVAIPNISGSLVHPVPTPCPSGTFYPYTRGYRKVSGDTCQGGDEHRYGPLLYSCPFSDQEDFLLIKAPDALAVCYLDTPDCLTIIDEYGIDLATYDYQANCFIYFKRPGMLKKLCVERGTTENRSEQMIRHFQNASIDCLEFDWTGRTLFLCDHASHTITALSIDGLFERQLYHAGHGIKKPRSLTIDPHHGYFYFVDQLSATQNTYGIFRLVMDGSDTKATLLVNDTFVTEDTYLTLNIEAEELYWASRSKQTLFASNITGQDIRYLSTDSVLATVHDIGLYKNELVILNYWTNVVLRIRTDLSGGWSPLLQDTRYTVNSFQVVSSTSQHAMSACSDYHSKCSQLCLPRPTPNPSVSSDPQNRTCLCGEGFRRQKVSEDAKDESCMCEQGETKNGSVCVKDSSASSCANDKLTCNNGRCVLLTWKCDGMDDCGDNTDELDCPYTTCVAGTFTCANGKCIPERWVCDREDDCKDGQASDETNCAKQNCTSDQFSCDNGYCIQRAWVCDGDNDCNDMSDERNCNATTNQTTTTCHSWEFRCADGECVSLYSRCDGIADCPDGSDEANGCNDTSCSSWEFECKDGGCIWKSWLCDNEADCEDGSDEVNCSTSSNQTTEIMPTPTQLFCLDSYTCKNGHCVGFIVVCNGVDDCGDGSDELGCALTNSTPRPPQSTSPAVRPRHCEHPNFVPCPNITNSLYCIHGSRLCDGIPDCPNGGDEKGCIDIEPVICAKNQFMCETDRNCIPISRVCDGRDDCSDRSDEWGCGISHGNHNYTCQKEEFACEDQARTCVPFTAACNWVYECPNSHDEFNCSACTSLRGLVYSSGAIAECDPAVALCPAMVWEESQNTSISWFWTALSHVTIAYRPLNEPEGQKEIFSKMTVKASDSTATITDLQPATVYKFVFLEEHQSKLCPLGSFEKSTKEGLPSPPENLHFQAHLYDEELRMLLLWDEPKIPRGHIKTYHVYWQEVDKDLKPLQNKVETREYIADNLKNSDYLGSSKHFDSTYSLSLTLPVLTHKHKYQFWVAASTDFGLGEKSKKMTVDPSTAHEEVNLSLEAQVFSDTAVALTWKKDQDADSYVIVGQSASGQNIVEVTIDKSKTSTTVNGLCPGWPAMFTIQSQYKSSKGTKYTSKRVVLNGEYPHIDSVKIERTGPTSVYVTIKPKKIYTVYFIYFSHHGISPDGQSLYHPQNVTTKEEEIEIKGLEACERYFLGVVPAYQSCPLQGMQSFVTTADNQAPPKDLRYHLLKESDRYDVKLTWHPSCYQLVEPLNYIITMRKGSEPPSQMSMANATSKTDIEYKVNYLQFGQTYTFSVRADVAAARNSPSIVVHIPEASGPTELRVIYIDLQKRLIKLTWHWPKSSYKHFWEYVVTTRDRFGDFLAVNHTIENELTLKLPYEGDFNYTVVAMSKDDQIIGMSHTLEFDFYIPDITDDSSDDDSHISKTNMVAIMVPVGIVVVLLSAGLVFFIVRHRRLQRSFLAFANSHYNIQSGTTTFSEDLDGDEPMIQGFADDEPLVIA